MSTLLTYGLMQGAGVGLGYPTCLKYAQMVSIFWPVLHSGLFKSSVHTVILPIEAFRPSRQLKNKNYISKC